MIRSRFDGRQKDVSIEQGLVCGESMTKQSFKDEVNINNILERHRKTGIITHVNRYQGRYDDVSQGVDYQTAMNTVLNAQEMFMTLPATVRARFENDPGKYLFFATDPRNIDEMRKMGLAKAAPAPAGDVPAGEGAASAAG